MKQADAKVVDSVKPPVTGATDELAELHVQCWTKLFNKLQVWRSFWQELAELVQPRKAEITTKTTTPNLGRDQRLFDSTAVRCNLTHARGMMAMMTPAGSPWFSFDPPASLKNNDSIKQWYRECTEVAQVEIAASNFYTQELDNLLDYGGFGTAAMFCEEGRKTTLNFRNFEIGQYAISEDEEGNVDTLYFEFKMTVRQLVRKFGEAALSEATRKISKDEKRQDEEIDILHCIYPRKPSDYDPRLNDGPNKPIASLYIEKTAKKVVSNSGYQEMPVFASRYLKWGSQVYGWCPSWAALPDARQLNFLVKQLDALAEVKAFPRMLVPDTHEEEIDVRAHGVTYFNQAGGKPEVWMDNGDYATGLDRENRKQQAIEKAFHTDLFEMFSNRDKVMTAREVSELSGEKLTQLVATSSSRTTEHYNPLLARVWGILIRAGKFPPIPDELIERDAAGMGYVPEPKISYSSRIALAIKAVENTAFMRHAEGFMALWQLQPQMLDNYNWDEIVRDSARNEGFPARWLVDMDDINKLRDARAQQQAKQQQLAEGEVAANTAKAVGQIGQDSALGQHMEAAA